MTIYIYIYTHIYIYTYTYLRSEDTDSASRCAELGCAMLRIRSAVSGEELTALEAAEIEGTSGKELKSLGSVSVPERGVKKVLIEW